MIRFRASLLSRSWAVEIALALGCIAAMYLEARLRELDLRPAEHAWILLSAVPVLLRRQPLALAPVAALALAFAGIFGNASVDAGVYQTIPGPAVLCAYEVANRYGRRVAIATAVVGLPLTLTILQLYSPHALFSWGTAQNLALVVLPLSLGVAAHDRRAYTQALVERAHTAERNQEEMARRRVSEERLRIARDVHDVVAHAMVTINVQAGVGAYLLRSDPDEAHTALRTIKQVSGDALTDLRSMLGVIRADDQDTEHGAPAEPGPPVQGIAALDDLTEGLRTAGIDLTVDIDAAARTLPTSVDTTAYRIVRECLTNTLRHAGPTTARIRVTHLGDQVLIDVTDDGGTPTAHLTGSGTGNGVRGMRERAAAVGGSLQAGPRPGGGWQVTASLPLNPKSPAPRDTPSPEEATAP